MILLHTPTSGFLRMLEDAHVSGEETYSEVETLERWKVPLDMVMKY